MDKPRFCPFCGGQLNDKQALFPSALNAEVEELNAMHLAVCRIRRFNEACDAAFAGLVEFGKSYSNSPPETARRTVDYARALVEAIEKEAHEQK